MKASSKLSLLLMKQYPYLQYRMMLKKNSAQHRLSTVVMPLKYGNEMQFLIWLLK